MLGQPPDHSRLRGRAAPRADRADPARRRAAQLRHPQRHAGGVDRSGPAPVDRRTADLARRPRRRRLGHAQGPGLPHRPVPPCPPQGSARMLNLAEYRKKTTGLCRLPAVGLPGRRPASSSTRTARSSARCATAVPTSTAPPRPSWSPSRARLNNVLKRFGAGWALFFEAERVPANAVSRRALCRSRLLAGRPGALRRLQCRRRPPREPLLPDLPLPAAARARGSRRALPLRAHGRHGDRGGAARPARVVRDRDRPRLADAGAPSCPRPRRSAMPRHSTYLHGTISNKRQPVAVPAIPTHLDAILCDTPLLGGVEPKLGDQHLRVLTVLGFPNVTTPGVLDALNDLGFAYRWMTRWIALDKTEATRTLTRLRRQWFAKRKSVGAILREVMFNRETALVDPDADNKATRCRRGAAGARRRRRRLRLSHHHDRRSATPMPSRPTRSCWPSSASSTAAASSPSARP